MLTVAAFVSNYRLAPNRIWEVLSWLSSPSQMLHENSSQINHNSLRSMITKIGFALCWNEPHQHRPLRVCFNTGHLLTEAGSPCWQSHRISSWLKKRNQIEMEPVLLFNRFQWIISTAPFSWHHLSQQCWWLSLACALAVFIQALSEETQNTFYSHVLALRFSLKQFPLNDGVCLLLLNQSDERPPVS